ncbi:MAG: PD-(D/E)XK nuclease family protein [Candidatus Aenigmarchaeota archaeon]|nr:PD-(D/E)XK nuclease family protein [Candidatus Aenigmarchaeota archaeon]
MFTDSSGRWIKISDLHAQAYCEYQLHFSWQGIDPKTEAMIAGSLRHAQLEEEHKEKMKETVKMSVEEAIKIGAKGSGRELRIKSREYRLYGLIDEVQLQSSAVFIIDDKPGGKAYRSATNQARAYSLCFLSEFNPPKPVFSVIRDSATGEVTWMEQFNDEAKKDIEEVVARVHALARGERDFVATKMPWKCAKCRFAAVCDRKLQSKQPA